MRIKSNQAKISRFPTIKRKMKQGKYNSIIIFNATSEEHPRALSEYPHVSQDNIRLHHLLDEVYGTGVSSDDAGTMLVAFIDNALTMISNRRFANWFGKPADISNGQFDFPFRRER